VKDNPTSTAEISFKSAQSEPPNASDGRVEPDPDGKAVEDASPGRNGVWHPSEPPEPILQADPDAEEEDPPAPVEVSAGLELTSLQRQLAEKGLATTGSSKQQMDRLIQHTRNAKKKTNPESGPGATTVGRTPLQLKLAERGLSTVGTPQEHVERLMEDTRAEKAASKEEPHTGLQLKLAERGLCTDGTAQEQLDRLIEDARAENVAGKEAPLTGLQQKLVDIGLSAEGTAPEQMQRLVEHTKASKRAEQEAAEPLTPLQLKLAGLGLSTRGTPPEQMARLVDQTKAAKVAEKEGGLHLKLFELGLETAGTPQEQMARLFDHTRAEKAAEKEESLTGLQQKLAEKGLSTEGTPSEQMARLVDHARAANKSAKEPAGGELTSLQLKLGALGLPTTGTHKEQLDRLINHARSQKKEQRDAEMLDVALLDPEAAVAYGIFETEPGQDWSKRIRSPPRDRAAACEWRGSSWRDQLEAAAKAQEEADEQATVAARKKVEDEAALDRAKAREAAEKARRRQEADEWMAKGLAEQKANKARLEGGTVGEAGWKETKRKFLGKTPALLQLKAQMGLQQDADEAEVQASYANAKAVHGIEEDAPPDQVASRWSTMKQKAGLSQASTTADLNAKIFAIAAKKMAVSVEKLELVNGWVRIKNEFIKQPPVGVAGCKGEEPLSQSAGLPDGGVIITTGLTGLQVKLVENGLSPDGNPKEQLERLLAGKRAGKKADKAAAKHEPQWDGMMEALVKVAAKEEKRDNKGGTAAWGALRMNLKRASAVENINPAGSAERSDAGSAPSTHRSLASVSTTSTVKSTGSLVIDEAAGEGKKSAWGRRMLHVKMAAKEEALEEEATRSKWSREMLSIKIAAAEQAVAAEASEGSVLDEVEAAASEASSEVGGHSQELTRRMGKQGAAAAAGDGTAETAGNTVSRGMKSFKEKAMAMGAAGRDGGGGEKEPLPGGDGPPPSPSHAAAGSATWKGLLQTAIRLREATPPIGPGTVPASGGREPWKAALARAIELKEASDVVDQAPAAAVGRWGGMRERARGLLVKEEVRIPEGLGSKAWAGLKGRLPPRGSAVDMSSSEVAVLVPGLGRMGVAIDKDGDGDIDAVDLDGDGKVDAMSIEEVLAAEEANVQTEAEKLVEETRLSLEQERHLLEKKREIRGLKVDKAKAGLLVERERLKKEARFPHAPCIPKPRTGEFTCALP